MFFSTYASCLVIFVLVDTYFVVCIFPLLGIVDRSMSRRTAGVDIKKLPLATVYFAAFRQAVCALWLQASDAGLFDLP